jgi:hypothetical protein
MEVQLHTLLTSVLGAEKQLHAQLLLPKGKR